MFNKFIIAGLVGLAIVTSLGLGYKYVTNLQEENATLSANNSTLTASNESLKTTLKDTEDKLKKISEQRDQLDSDLQESREKSQRIIKLFADHDFANLVAKKPGLIETRINKGTSKIFKDFEGIANE